MLARESFDVAEDQALGHYTHEKNPVACAASLATLEVIEEEDLLERAETLGRYAKGRLEALRSRVPLIHEVRGIGLVLGLVLRLPDGGRATEVADRVLYEALSRGLSFKVTMGSILTLTPPLTISKEELDEALDILESCFLAP